MSQTAKRARVEPGRPGFQYDLVIKGGRVIDPKSGLDQVVRENVNSVDDCAFEHGIRSINFD